MDSGQVEQLQDRLLLCPICMDVFTDPRCLPCLHTVCFSCLSRLPRTGDQVISCPECRTTVEIPAAGMESFPVNFFINSLKQELRLIVNFVPCRVCLRERVNAAFHCQDCDLSICRYCIHEHKLFGHDVPSPYHISCLSNNQARGDPYEPCFQHKTEPIQMYCLNCKQALCILCFYKEHKNHRTVSKDELLNNFHQDLQKDLDQLVVESNTAQQHLDVLRNLKLDVLSDSRASVEMIKQQGEFLHKEVDRHIQTKVSEIIKREKETVDEIEEHSIKVKQYLAQMKRAITFLEELSQTDINLPLVQSFGMFKQILDLQLKDIKSKPVLKILRSKFNKGKLMKYLQLLISFAIGFTVWKKQNFYFDGSARESVWPGLKSVSWLTMENLGILFIFTSVGMSLLKCAQSYFNEMTDYDSLAGIICYLYLLICFCLTVLKSKSANRVKTDIFIRPCLQIMKSYNT